MAPLKPRGGLPLAVVPAFDRPLTPVTPERRQRFRQRLLGIAREAMEGPVPEAAERGAAFLPEQSAEDAALLSQACALCRGYCCRLGHGRGGHIDAATIRRYLEEHPDSTPEEVADRYLAHVRDETYRSSCIYHAEGGCSLPRDMKAEICGRYWCDGLIDFRKGLPDGAPRRAYGLAVREGAVVREATLGAPDAP